MVRGCANQLNQTECDSETCQTCRGSNCNSGLFPAQRLSCITCTGDANSTCAGNITLPMTICPIYRDDDRCFVARPEGNFERGCLSSATQTCQGNFCQTCVGMGCNFEDFNGATALSSVAKILPFIFISVALTILNK